MLEGSIKALAMDAGGKVKEKKARLPAAIYIQTREEWPTQGLKREGLLSTQMVLRLDCLDITLWKYASLENSVQIRKIRSLKRGGVLFFLGP